MSGHATPPIPPRPDLAQIDTTAWAVLPPDRPGIVRRAVEIWRRTLPAALALTVLLQGIPTLLQRLMTPRWTGPTFFSEWLETGRLPDTLPQAPQPAPHALALPLSLVASIVLIPLLYVTLLRLMMGASVGEHLGVRRALACGGKRLGPTIVVGLCAGLILIAIGIPLGLAFVAFVTAHAWKLGAVVCAIGFGMGYATISLSVAVLLVEGATGFRATGRSWRLTWSEPRRVIGVFGGLLVLSFAVGLLPGFLVPRLVEGSAGLLIEGLVALAIGAFITTMLGALITSTYVEVRARAEAVAPGALAWALRSGDPTG